MKIEDMIKQNNELREHLNTENKNLYRDIVVYLRCSHVSEQQAEELLCHEGRRYPIKKA